MVWATYAGRHKKYAAEIESGMFTSRRLKQIEEKGNQNYDGIGKMIECVKDNSR